MLHQMLARQKIPLTATVGELYLQVAKKVQLVKVIQDAFIIDFHASTEKVIKKKTKRCMCTKFMSSNSASESLELYVCVSLTFAAGQEI